MPEKVSAGLYLPTCAERLPVAGFPQIICIVCKGRRVYLRRNIDMKITKTMENNKVTLSVEGWLDTQSSPELGKEIRELSDPESLILDFEKLEYISSSGLREVVSAYKKMKSAGGDFAVINVSSEVMDVFRLTGFDKKLDIRAK